jgi:hypothetical protein
MLSVDSPHAPPMSGVEGAIVVRPGLPLSEYCSVTSCRSLARQWTGT